MNTARDIRNQIEYAAEEGKAEAKVAIARSLKAEGVDIYIISRTTGLTVEEIKAL